jgi:ribosomal peptide maturation radical SAM protein 1
VNLALGSWTLAPGHCDALIIVPPFGEVHYPSLGAHVLQACARGAGFKVSVFYANLLFAAMVGPKFHSSVARAFPGAFIGERLFARAAYGLPPLGRHAEDMCAPDRILGNALGVPVYGDFLLGARELLRDAPIVEARVPEWVEAVGAYIGSLGIKVIGATSTFEQTAPAISLLKAASRNTPEVVTIIGGANCEGEMAQGICGVAPFIDYVFAGESEATFPALLTSLQRGERPAQRIVSGTPCQNLDAIPQLDFDDYFEQRTAFLRPETEAELESVSLPYETSRGCWWGEKHHCTFCGLNGDGMAFRTRSVERTMEELRKLSERYRTKRFLMADNIMPHRFFSTLVPSLAAELPDLSIFYEQKANLPRERLVALKNAGIDTIQPGIEALSSDLLRQMRKGVSARQNLALLRNARGLNISLVWNLLWGFPGDRLDSYRETLALLPLLHHLQPPSGFWPVLIDRFSPYYYDAKNFGITNIRPLPGYFDITPAGAAVDYIAYHFNGDFESASAAAPELMRELQGAVVAWRQRWAATPTPELRVGEYHGVFVLIDTRGLSNAEPVELLDPIEASQLVTAGPYDNGAEQSSLIARKLAVVLDGWFVPLAVIDQTTLALLNEAAAPHPRLESSQPIRAAQP